MKTTYPFGRSGGANVVALKRWLWQPNYDIVVRQERGESPTTRLKYLPKRSVLNRRISPYVDVKAVQYIDLTAGSTNYGITPSLGIDCGRFSVGVGYELRGNRSALQLGLGLNF